MSLNLSVDWTKTEKRSKTVPGGFLKGDTYKNSAVSIRHRSSILDVRETLKMQEDQTFILDPEHCEVQIDALNDYRNGPTQLTFKVPYDALIALDDAAKAAGKTIVIGHSAEAQTELREAYKAGGDTFKAYTQKLGL